MPGLAAHCLLAALAFGLGASRLAADVDGLFTANRGAHSDRAAGIGKRIKPGATLELADIRGPAIIRHFWMTNVRPVESAILSGRVVIRFYWDGHPEPDLVIPLNEFFGRRFTASPDLVFPMVLGKNAYYEIPFRRGARIELWNDTDVELWGVYWQIDYDRVERFPANAGYFQHETRVPPPPILGRTPDGSAHRQGRVTLPPRTNARIATLNGPAVIRRFRIECDDPRVNDDVLTNRGVIVRIFWDGEEHPSVEVPLGEFFGMGFGERRDFSSAAWVQAGARRELLFPMPFRRSARIEFENLTGKPLGPFDWRVDFEKRESAFAASEVEQFHACFRMSRPVPLNSTHVAMETDGRGKFVGFVWSCHWLNAEQKPEGTQNFWVDGRRIQSTGSEDYFGRAWGFGSEPECHAFKGINLGPEKSASAAVPPEWRRVTAYRAHILDPIHFQASLKLDFTCYGYNRGHRTDDYATACFWYQSEPHTRFTPLPPLEDLLPLDHPDSFGFGQYQIAQAEARRDWASALAACEALSRAYPANPKAGDLRFKRGNLLEELRRTNEALEVFREIARAGPHAELARDAADKVWLLEAPGRMLLKAAAPSSAVIFVDGTKVMLPASEFQGVPAWGHAEIYRFTYPAFRVAWDSPSSAIMRLPAVRLSPGVGPHTIALVASAAQAEPIFTPRVGYFFATLDVAGPDVVTDASWRISPDEIAGWESRSFDDSGWPPATAHPLSAFGDGAWTWLWPRGFRNFPGTMQRIWSSAIVREDKAFRESLLLRKRFEIPAH